MGDAVGLISVEVWNGMCAAAAYGSGPPRRLETGVKLYPRRQSVLQAASRCFFRSWEVLYDLILGSMAMISPQVVIPGYSSTQSLHLIIGNNLIQVSFFSSDVRPGISEETPCPSISCGDCASISCGMGASISCRWDAGSYSAFRPRLRNNTLGRILEPN